MHARWCPPRAAPPCHACRRCATAFPPGITSLTPTDYRNPGELPDGGVLVVGASASGIQIAEELHRSGRPVTLAVGEHVRMPRTYRGRDILWWMDATGLLDERYDEIPDLPRARRLPSMQLVGSPERRTVDLNALRRLGVRLVGRLAGIRDGVAQFSGSLANVCALADLKLGRLLDTFDAWAAEAVVDGLGAAATVRRHRDSRARAVGSRSTLAARSRRSSGPPGSGRICRGSMSRFSTGRAAFGHDGGVTASPGLYLIGMPFLRRRKSSLIDGAADDAADVTDHLARYVASALRSRPWIATTT